VAAEQATQPGVVQPAAEEAAAELVAGAAAPEAFNP